MKYVHLINMLNWDQGKFFLVAIVIVIMFKYFTYIPLAIVNISPLIQLQAVVLNRLTLSIRNETKLPNSSKFHQIVPIWFLAN